MAAAGAAGRVADEMGCEVGQTVGYSVRFEESFRPGTTQIKYTTGGTLFRESMFDPLLSRYSVIMIDEAHERSLHTDLLLGLLKRIVGRRADLRIIISSATIDAERFLEYFGSVTRTAKTVSGPSMPQTISQKQDETKKPAIIRLEGKIFPLEIGYLREACEDPIGEAIDTILAISREFPRGDVLVFLTGMAEIERVAEELSQELPPAIQILTLHASMNMSEQMGVLKAAPPGHRKVILATNIAETSLTISGIVYVVDTGAVRVKEYDPSLGIHRMRTVRISKSSARQRAGRAGREQAGKVFRCYTQDQYEEMADYSPPEIQTTDLTGTILQLKALGINDILSFGWIDSPLVDNTAAGLQSLHALGAIDDSGKLTADGRILAELPVDPRLGKMILSAAKLGCASETITIAAMTSVGDIFQAGIPDDLRQKQGVEQGDLLSFLNIYHAYQENKANALKWAPRHGLLLGNLQKAERCRASLVAQLKHLGVATSSSSPDPALIQKAIFCGLFQNLAESQPDGTYRLLHSPQTVFWIHPESVLFKRAPSLVVFGEAVQTTKAFLRHLSVADKTWAAELVPHYYKTVTR